MLDDATRRQLRFSLFLQGFAFLMLAVALVVRVSAFGWDVVDLFLALGLVVVARSEEHTSELQSH